MKHGENSGGVSLMAVTVVYAETQTAGVQHDNIK